MSMLAHRYLILLRMVGRGVLNPPKPGWETGGVGAALKIASLRGFPGV